jgi:hypothetical protein
VAEVEGKVEEAVVVAKVVVAVAKVVAAVARAARGKARALATPEAGPAPPPTSLAGGAPTTRPSK